MLSQKSPLPSPCPASLPTHSHFLALMFSCIGAYKVCKTKGPLFPFLADWEAEGKVPGPLTHQPHYKWEGPRISKCTKIYSFFSSSFSFQFLIRYFLHLHFKYYPEISLYSPPVLLSYPPTPTSWPWCSPVLGHIKFASLPYDGQLGHLLLHMQLETRALGVLVSSYCWSTTI